MSHTATIDTIKIVDINALRKACDELRRTHGVDLTVKDNHKPRAWYEDQEGMSEPANVCIVLNDSKYDVGIYKKADGTYEARCDFYSGDIERALGADVKGMGSLSKEQRTQAKLGKLYQLYAVNAAENAIVREGGHCTRTVTSDGSIQLQMVVNG